MNTKQFDKKIIATFKALVADNFFVNNKFEDIQELDDYIYILILIKIYENPYCFFANYQN